jgi:CBS domain-containing protein/sporulation protein YlmC with PRC-barrel domain
MKFEGEIFVSELIGIKVLDRSGEIIGLVKDFTAVRGDIFPQIDNFVIKKEGKLYLLSWDDIELFNREFTLCKSNAGEIKLKEPTEEDIFVVKDIMDKQIVDINGAKLVRANDLKIREIGEKLCIIAVDVGFRGLLRRLGLKGKGGKFWKILVKGLPYDLISWGFIQPLEPKVTKLVLSIPKDFLSQQHPYDIANILAKLPPDEQESLIESIGVEKVAEALPELDDKRQVEIMERLEKEKAADILEAMPPDEAADLLGDLSEEKAEELMGEMEKEVVEEVKELLQHEDDTAGGLMTTEFIALRPYMTVEETLSFLRLTAPDVENVNTIFITDENDRLLGFVTIRDLFINPPDAPLVSIMNQKVKSATPESEGMEVAKTMAKYNLLSLPVLDRENRLIGIITVDDVLEFMLPSIKKRKKF